MASMDMNRSTQKFSASIRLSIAIGLILILTWGGILWVINWQMRKYARLEATEKSMILLERNLATHTYFSHQLKPALFKKMAPFTPANYFDPIWMSSTYAVREIDKYHHQLSQGEYYYKEAAINARSPENEADSFERTFIEELNQDPKLMERSEVRIFGQTPFFVALRRGESMEEGCLLCHSTPDAAPADLVVQYGPDRSFQRSEGETVSAISIRIPLSEAYAAADQLMIKLSGVFGCALLLVSALIIFLNRSWVFNPLNKIRIKALHISKDPQYLGDQIVSPASREMADLTAAFNHMSSQLRQERDKLESRVQERTKDLHDANFYLSKEVNDHRKTIINLEKSLKEIKTLRGILPICSHCKKIRSDEGYWHQIESYIGAHSEADFSHSICPDCRKMFYPEFDPPDS